MLKAKFGGDRLNVYITLSYMFIIAYLEKLLQSFYRMKKNERAIAIYKCLTA